MVLFDVTIGIVPESRELYRLIYFLSICSLVQYNFNMILPVPLLARLILGDL